MASIIQIRRDTASDWTSANPTLAQGELGLETDTLKLKAGTGTTAWNSLAYYTLATAGFLATSGGTLTGALTTNSTIDGRDVSTDGTKLDGIEASADVTDATNVAAAGALMDSEVTNLASVKAFDTTDYATSTQGTTADAALPKAGGTMSGLVNMADQILQRTVLKDYGETKVAMAAHAVDLELGNVFTYTLSGGQTVTFTNPPASGTAGSFTMIVTNGGSATLTWPTSVDWPAGIAPALTASGVDLIFFTTIDGGTIWYGTAVLAMG